MPATDPFLERCIQHVRDFAMDTISEVRWPKSRLVELIDTANGLVFGEILATAEPKTHTRFAEASIAISSAAQDYDWPGNVRRFLRLVKKDAQGRIEREQALTDYMHDAPGVILLDQDRGFRITPVPQNAAAENWTLVYEAGATPYLCYGTITSATASGAVLTAPSASQLGTLSLDDLFYVNSAIRIVSGTGAGQERRITDYVGSTRAITIHKPWAVNPTGTSIYEILPCLRHPLDKAIAWRVVMMLKASDSDAIARAAAKEEFKEIMREVLLKAADRQGRHGPSMGSEPVSIFNFEDDA